MTRKDLRDLVDSATPETPDPIADLEADHVPSAAGMFTCMVISALMLVLWVAAFYAACWR
jgi:hypothetical protein